MKKTLFTLFAFLVVGFIIFLVLSTSGFLGEDIGQKGQEISGSIEKAVNQAELKKV